MASGLFARIQVPIAFVTRGGWRIRYDDLDDDAVNETNNKKQIRSEGTRARRQSSQSPRMQ